MEKEESPINTGGKIAMGLASLAASFFVTKKIYKLKEDPVNKETVDAIKTGWKLFIAYVIISSLLLLAIGLIYVLYKAIEEGVFDNPWHLVIALLMLLAGVYSFTKQAKKK